MSERFGCCSQWRECQEAVRCVSELHDPEDCGLARRLGLGVEAPVPTELVSAVPEVVTTRTGQMMMEL